MSLAYPYFKLGSLNSFVLLAIGMFFVLTLLYSFRFMQGKSRLFEYYTYIILTGLASAGAAFTNNLLILVVFWGFLGFTLFMLVGMGADKTGSVAQKTFIIVGGSDVVMLLGIGIIYYLTGSLQMDKIRLSLQGNSYLPYLAYFCIAIACFAKAGAMPFHSWIPGCAQDAPLPVVAYLPAALDKLLGIYLLAKISIELFIINDAISITLMVIGSFTVLAAVMMALIQHNMKRLLGYHAISQVGYMVLGIACANPIGIAGGLFHMLNHSIYKSCLFFTAGNVEYRQKTTELDDLGGLGRLMPLTYVACLIASLSICGVPPFNGFVSKWLIYQGLVERLSSTGLLKVVTAISLIAALFGSGLTLASFMKLLHAVFLGQKTEQAGIEKKEEVPGGMLIPCVVLSSLCIIFGVFANQIPLKFFIMPVVGRAAFIGIWHAGLSVLLVGLGLLLGFAFFKFSGFKIGVRRDSVFVGGETADFKENAVTGTDFYNAVKEYGVLKKTYSKAGRGDFDIYEQAKKLKVFSLPLQFLHNGVLPTYLVWILLGMLALFFILM